MNLSRSGWTAPPDKPPWPDAEVHVWRTTLDWPDHTLNELRGLLSPDERARVERFYFEKDRRSHLVSRGWLRKLLGLYLDLPPQKLVFETNGFGKPSLASPRTPLRFNVSHSGALVLIAVTSGRELGVDVEHIRHDMAIADIASHFFSAIECEVLAALPESQKRDAFFDCWTRKEAYIKAHGSGLSLPLDQFDVTLRPREPARLLATRHDPSDAPRWELCALDMSEGYKAAVAVERPASALVCWDWPSPSA